MKTLGLLLLLAVGPGASAQFPVQFSGEHGGIALGHPEVLDGLLVGTVLGPPEWPSQPGARGAVQRVRVEDSRAFAPGTVVSVALSVMGLRTRERSRSGPPRVDPATAMPIGRRVLVVGPAARGGALSNPTSAGPYLDNNSPTPCGPEPTMRALIYFRTARTRLADVADPEERYLASVADAIPGTDDANVAAVARFLHSIRSPGWSGTWASGHEDDRLSRLFAAAAARATPYQRAQVYYGLNYLHYIGYSDRYEAAVLDSADQPDAFAGGEVPRPSWWEDTTNSGTIIASGFRHVRVDEARAEAAILRGKSPAVRAHLLNRIRYRDLAGARRLAPLLEDPDPAIRWAFVHNLVLWLKEGPAPAAIQRENHPDGSETLAYSGLDEAVATWKARLLALPKAP